VVFWFIHQEQHFSSLHFTNQKGKVSQEKQSKHDSKTLQELPKMKK
jgi:hypothetical protein